VWQRGRRAPGSPRSGPARGGWELGPRRALLHKSTQGRKKDDLFLLAAPSFPQTAPRRSHTIHTTEKARATFLRSLAPPEADKQKNSQKQQQHKTRERE